MGLEVENERRRLGAASFALWGGKLNRLERFVLNGHVELAGESRGAEHRFDRGLCVRGRITARTEMRQDDRRQSGWRSSRSNSAEARLDRWPCRTRNSLPDRRWIVARPQHDLVMIGFDHQRGRVPEQEPHGRGRAATS